MVAFGVLDQDINPVRWQGKKCHPGKVLHSFLLLQGKSPYRGIILPKCLVNPVCTTVPASQGWPTIFVYQQQNKSLSHIIL